jgi:hypothetical protein
VIYSGFTGILNDHATLEKRGMLSWQEVAACHRDLEAHSQGVNGEIPTHSQPPFRFPAAVYLESALALTNALVSYRKWTDIEILMERNILLGPNQSHSLAFIHEIRLRQVTNLKKAYNKLISIERDTFYENSYFFQHNIKSIFELLSTYMFLALFKSNIHGCELEHLVRN